MISVEFANRQPQPLLPERWFEAVRRVLLDQKITTAQVSLAVVSDSEIQQINRRFLAHDNPTDVISFVLEKTDRELIAEIVASYDTARESASRFGWDVQSELLLYFIHGALHLVGYDDATEAQRSEMRHWERHYLQTFGLTPRYESDDSDGE